MPRINVINTVAIKIDGRGDFGFICISANRRCAHVEFVPEIYCPPDYLAVSMPKAKFLIMDFMRRFFAALATPNEGHQENINPSKRTRFVSHDS